MLSKSMRFNFFCCFWDSVDSRRVSEVNEVYLVLSGFQHWKDDDQLTLNTGMKPLDNLQRDPFRATKCLTWLLVSQFWNDLMYIEVWATNGGLASNILFYNSRILYLSVSYSSDFSGRWIIICYGLSIFLLILENMKFIFITVLIMFGGVIVESGQA